LVASVRSGWLRAKVGIVALACALAGATGARSVVKVGMCPRMGSTTGLEWEWSDICRPNQSSARLPRIDQAASKRQATDEKARALAAPATGFSRQILDFLTVPLAIYTRGHR